MMKYLVAVPVYNEAKVLAGVLNRILEQTTCLAEAGFVVDLLTVNDGSTDGTTAILGDFSTIFRIHHPTNLGYGAALRSAFSFAMAHDYDCVAVLDSDGQHDPSLLADFFAACRDFDIVSGSRYLEEFPANTPAPPERRRINGLLTDCLNAQLELDLTDAFCGFKAYRVSALRKMTLTENGYAMPLELWVQAACQRLRVTELAVPRVYLDPQRTFGATLDDANLRLSYYQEVIDQALRRARARTGCGLYGRRTTNPTP